MASFTIGAGGDRADIETAASDPVSNPVGTPTDWYYLEDQVPVANVATINSNVTIYSNGYKTDTSKISSGICLQGGTWERADIRRYNNTAAVLLQNATTTRSTVYAPLQDGAVVGCTGDINAVTTLNGDATGLTGTDNKFVVNVAGVPNAYEDTIKSLYYKGVLGQDSTLNADIVLTDFDIRFSAQIDSSGVNIIIGKCGNTQSFISYVSGNTFRLRFDDNTNADITKVLSDGAYDFRVTYAPSGDITLFVDGVEESSVNVTGKTLTVNCYGGGYDGVQFPYIGMFYGLSINQYDGTKELEFDFTKDDFGGLVNFDQSGNANNGSVNGGVWALPLENSLTPKIGGSLLITSGPNAGLYAGGVQPPSEADEHYGYEYSYEY